MRFVLSAMISAILLASPAQAERPNIIVILSDDQTEANLVGSSAIDGKPFMPFLHSIRTKARHFTEMFFTQSLCCPSRTSILTGMYPHNHGVEDNEYPAGGYRRYAENQLDQVSWPKLLHDDGYYTAMVGKFLNKYSKDFAADIPAGWDYWFSLLFPGSQDPFDYKVSINGVVIRITSADDSNYQTNRIRDEAIAVIHDRAADRQPFAMLLTPYAPHLPAVPAQKYAGIYADEPFGPGLSPSFNESDVSDKPSFVQASPQLTSAEIDEEATLWRSAIESARSIDDLFAGIWQELKDDELLDNTIIVYMSDNGYLWGEHRVTGKIVPYRESVHSTAYVWGPGFVTGTDRHLVANTDIMPTILEATGRQIPSWVDGRSLLPLLFGQSPPWRNILLGQGIPPGDSEGGSVDTAGLVFKMLASRNADYIVYENGEREYYDLNADPYQLDNAVTGLNPSTIAAMDQKIQDLSACAGIACRDIEAARLYRH
jgi:N-acetylglucosamine-6-sulfatase